MATPNSLSALGQAALAYAGKGWPVFPCKQRGKEPLVRDWPNAATTNPERIRTWWNEHPTANIGHPTGKHVVLDIDGEGGEAALELLEKQHGPLPNTLTARTGKGRHLYFDANGTRIRNSAGKVGPHLDVRGEGGYVILPPSIHANGNRYEWINKRNPAPLPTWVAALLSEPTQTRTDAKSAEAKIPEGQRNEHLASLAGSMRRRGMTQEAILAALLAENAKCCEPELPQVEVQRIAESVARYSPGTGFSPSGARPEGFSLVSLGELLARPEKPTDWLWQGRLAVGTVSAVVSKPKVGKSTFARNLCLAVARGEPFLGLRTKAGPCIYLALEERAQDVTADFRAMGANGDEQIFVHADTIPARGILALIDLLRERKTRLAVVDPLFRLAHIKDEKAYAETYSALGLLIDVARETETHILLTHHMGKGMAKADPVDSPLGSTALAGGVSSLVILKRTEAYRTVQTVQRLREESGDMPETVLQYDSESRRLSLGGTRFEADRQECEEAILEFLQAAGEAKTEPEIDDGVEGKNALKRKALRKLVENGGVTREGSGKRGDPYKYLYSCTHYIPGTRVQETQKAPDTGENTERNLVPTSKQKRILVPESGKPRFEGKTGMTEVEI